MGDLIFLASVAFFSAAETIIFPVEQAVFVFGQPLPLLQGKLTIKLYVNRIEL